MKILSSFVASLLFNDPLLLRPFPPLTDSLLQVAFSLLRAPFFEHLFIVHHKLLRAPFLTWSCGAPAWGLSLFVNSMIRLNPTFWELEKINVYVKKKIIPLKSYYINFIWWKLGKWRCFICANFVLTCVDLVCCEWAETQAIT